MKIKLVSETPTHIGNGNKYSSFEFLIKDKMLHRISLLNFLKSKDENFLKNLENCTSLHEFASYDDIKDFIKYSIKTEYTNIKDVREHIKENDIPYIPGSSVKGAIREALLWNYVVNDKNKINELLINLRLGLRYRKNKKEIGNFFINKIFNLQNNKYDAKYDLLKFLEISDFIPDRYNLEIINVKTHSLTRNRLEQKRFSIFAESLTGEFNGEINLQCDRLEFALRDKNNYPLLTDKLFILGIDQEIDITNFIIYLKNSLRKFNEWCLNKEIELCKQAENSSEFVKELEKIKTLNEKENLIRMGFGVGTIYQTLIKLVEEHDVKLAKEIVNNLKLGKFMRNFDYRTKDKLYPPYPKSIEFTDNNLPIGWLKWKEYC